MNYIDVFYQSDDGLRLYARDYPSAVVGAPIILCLPGLTRNSKDFATLANALQQTHRVICPDQRGRGRSARDAEPANYRPDQYATDMFTSLSTAAFIRVGSDAIIRIAIRPPREVPMITTSLICSTFNNVNMSSAYWSGR